MKNTVKVFLFKKKSDLSNQDDFKYFSDKNKNSKKTKKLKARQTKGATAKEAAKRERLFLREIILILILLCRTV